MSARPAIVSKPNTVILNGTRILLGQFHAIEDLSRRLFHFTKLTHKVPEFGFGRGGVGCEDDHAVGFGVGIFGRAGLAAYYLILTHFSGDRHDDDDLNDDDDLVSTIEKRTRKNTVLIQHCNNSNWEPHHTSSHAQNAEFAKKNTHIKSERTHNNNITTMAVHGAHLRDTPKKELVTKGARADDAGERAVIPVEEFHTDSYFDLYGCSRETGSLKIHPSGFGGNKKIGRPSPVFVSGPIRPL
eukprot:scaffold90767_cov63-Cyclotella_meneghiniana.AAC.2